MRKASGILVTHAIRWGGCLALLLLVSPVRAMSLVARWTVVNEPKGVAVGAQGDVYVTNQAGQVHVFSSKGELKSVWGAPGYGLGQLPPEFLAIAISGNGEIYLGDNAPRVQVFNSNHDFVRSWVIAGVRGRCDCRVTGIAVDASEQVYVLLDRGGVRVYDRDGVLLRSWGDAGSGAAEIINGQAIALDASGDVLVAGLSQRVQAFSPDGTYQGAWGELGALPGQFNQVYGLATDRSGRVYVADRYNARIQVFRREVFEAEIPVVRAPVGIGVFPWGLAIDEAIHGQLYVADPYGNCIHVFAELPTSTRRASWSDLKARYH